MNVELRRIIILRTNVLWHVYILSYTLASTDVPTNLSRIVGGQPGKIEYYPSYALLRVRLSSGRRMQCGSTYIHYDWLVTASHCLDWNFSTDKKPTVGKQDRIRVFMGADVLKKLKHKRSSVRLVIHPNYIRSFKTVNSTFYDIGLIKVNNPFDLSAMIRISTIAKQVWLNAVVQTVGFGMTNRNVAARVLHATELKITQIDKTVLICSNSDGRNFCSGDSGGPLYLKSTKGLVGIISTTYKECTHGVGIYVNVLTFKTWIQQTAHIPLRRETRSNTSTGNKLKYRHAILFGQLVVLYMFMFAESMFKYNKTSVSC